MWFQTLVEFKKSNVVLILYVLWKWAKTTENDHWEFNCVCTKAAFGKDKKLLTKSTKWQYYEKENYYYSLTGEVFNTKHFGKLQKKKKTYMYIKRWNNFFKKTM